MHKRAWALLAISLATLAFAKDKSKPDLPPYVLHAQTVAVIGEPGAGVAIDDPMANRTAQRDVEAALLSWGRFQMLDSPQSADLVIVLRKGNGRMVNETLSDPRQNRRPGSIDPMDGGASVGAQQGQQPSLSGGSGPASRPGEDASRPQTEIGEGDDSFLVYGGKVEKPLDSSPAWRYVARDGLRPHTVPAVAEFRKALVEAEKAAAKKP